MHVSERAFPILFCYSLYSEKEIVILTTRKLRKNSILTMHYKVAVRKMNKCTYELKETEQC